MNTPPNEAGNLFLQKLKIVDFVLFLLLVVFVLLRFSKINLVGMGQLMTLGFMSAGIFSLLLGLTDKGIYDVKNSGLLIILSLGCSFLCIGVLFSLQLWPGAQIMVKAGTLLSFVSLAWIAVTAGKNVFGLQNFWNQVLLAKLLFLTVVSLWFMLSSPLAIYKQISSYSTDPEAVRLYEDHLNNPTDTTKWDAYNAYTRMLREGVK